MLHLEAIRPPQLEALELLANNNAVRGGLAKAPALDEPLPHPIVRAAEHIDTHRVPAHGMFNIGDLTLGNEVLLGEQIEPWIEDVDDELPSRLEMSLDIA